MATATRPVTFDAPPDTRIAAAAAGAPAWLLGATAILLALTIAPHLPSPLTLHDGADGLALLWPTLRGAECVAFLWAARREALGRRLRQALWLFAGTWALGCAATASYMPVLIGGAPLLPEPLYRLAVNITYVTGLAAVLWMPRAAPATAAQRREFLLDLTMAVVGMFVIRVVLDWDAIVVNGALQIAPLAGVAPAVLMTAALTVFVLRGVARPSRRAFWLMAAATAGNIIVPVLYAVPAGVPFGLSFAMLVSMATLWAAHAYRDDPLSGSEATPVPAPLRAFNPLPPLITSGVALLLVRESLRPPVGHVPVLAITMLALTALLMLRSVTTSAENLRLVAEQAERDRVAEAARVAALTTLTGGIAHWYNNLLTVVLGNAELGEHAALGHDARLVSQSLGGIRSAAERAADLTRQLMAYAGRQVQRKDAVEMNGFVAEVVARLQPSLPAPLRVTVTPAPEAAWITGDRDQLAMVVEELLANAAQAMPRGGTVTIAVRVCQAPDHPTMAMSGLTGPCVTIDVGDDGPGAPPEVLAKMFDPFFTTRGMTQAAGLGLAAVRGVMAVHGGHVRAARRPAGGLVVTLVLPFAPSSAA